MPPKSKKKDAAAAGAAAGNTMSMLTKQFIMITATFVDARRCKPHRQSSLALPASDIARLSGRLRAGIADPPFVCSLCAALPSCSEHMSRYP
jgi:hypothetical protein